MERKESIEFAKRVSSTGSLDQQANAAARVTSELEANWKSSSFSAVVLKKEKVKIDVLITQPIVLDHHLFQLWLDGIPPQEAAQIRRLTASSALDNTSSNSAFPGINTSYAEPSSFSNASDTPGGNPNYVAFYNNPFPDILYRDTLDHYRNFTMLEHYLQQPAELSGYPAQSPLLIVDSKVFPTLVEKYYAILPEVIQRLAGKKLKHKTRHILDEINEKTRISLKSCRRQFDNLKRLYDFIMEKKREYTTRTAPQPVQQQVTPTSTPTGSGGGMAALNTSSSVITNNSSTSGNSNSNTNESGFASSCITNLIQKHFKLPRDLALQYSRYIFLCYHRIETGDKRLKYLNASDFEYFAAVLMELWTFDRFQLELDTKFKEDIRDCRTYLLSDKLILEKYKQLVIERMQQLGRSATPAVMEEKKLVSFMNNKFQVVVKTLLNIGVGISKSAEFEDIFEDLDEKVAAPMLKAELTKHEVDLFFKSMVEVFGTLLDSLTFTRHKQRFSKSWSRYLEGIRTCVFHMLLQRQQDVTREGGAGGSTTVSTGSRSSFEKKSRDKS